jgi:hypothetical protein
MTYFGLLVVAALSLSAAMPAAAMARGHHHHRDAYSRAYRAYGFYRGDDFAAGNISADFDRRNTFN